MASLLWKGVELIHWILYTEVSAKLAEMQALIWYITHVDFSVRSVSVLQCVH